MTKISIIEPKQKDIEIIKGKCYICIHYKTKKEECFLVLDDPMTDGNLIANLENGFLYTQDDFDDHYCIDRQVQEIIVVV